MRVLIAGRDGRVGSELVRAVDGIAEVIAPSRRKLDLTDEDAIIGAVRQHAPDLIINTSACGVGAEPDADTMLSVHAHAPRVFAEEADRLGIPLVHYSTDHLFDGTKDSPYVEDDDPSPEDVFGRAQLLGERAILRSGAPVLLIRVAWVYRIRDLTAETSYTGAQTVATPQTGSPTWGRHVAAATLQTLQALVGARGIGRDRLASALRERGGVLHMAAEGWTDQVGFSSAVANLATEEGAVPPLGTPKTPESRANGAPGRRNRRFDTSKLERDFGVRIPMWESGLREAWAQLVGQGSPQSV